MVIYINADVHDLYKTFIAIICKNINEFVIVFEKLHIHSAFA